MKIARRALSALGRVILHDKEVVKAEKGLVALIIVRVLIAVGASAGLVEIVQRAMGVLGLS